MAATDTQGTRLLAARVLAAQLAAQAAQLQALAGRAADDAAVPGNGANAAAWQIVSDLAAESDRAATRATAYLGRITPGP